MENVILFPGVNQPLGTNAPKEKKDDNGQKKKGIMDLFDEVNPNSPIKSNDISHEKSTEIDQHIDRWAARM